MQEVYELDKEIYGEYSSYDSFEDFKSFINNNHLSTYALKDNNGDIIGYYNLEPINNGELYIDSMGLKPQYRSTRKGDNAIQTAWDSILSFARDNGAETLSLHVDSSDTEQVELYQQLGFQTEQDLPNYWGTGQNAYFMKYSVGNASVQPETDSENVPNDNNIEENCVIDSELFVNSDPFNESFYELQEIYEIDKEAFAEQDPFESFDDYKMYLDEHNISVTSVKDDNNKLLGYYALEPVKDGNLYIYSIALKPEYRNTRKGYKAIQESWEKILNEAKNQGADKLSLHVDAENPKLKKMYEHLGFTTVSREQGYYNNGHDALYMERAIEDSSLSETQQTETVVGQAMPDNNIQIEPVQQKTTKDIYNEKVEQAKQKLEEQQIPERTGIDADTIIQKATVEKGKEKTFNDDIFSTATEVAELCKDLESDYWKKNSFDNIVDSLKEKDNDGNITVRKDVIPYLKRLSNLGVQANNMKDILNTVKTGNNRKNSSISVEELDSVMYLADKLTTKQRRNIDGIAGKCKLEDKNGQRYISRDVIDAYCSYMLYHDSDYHIDNVFTACTTKNEDGSDYFNKSTFNRLNKYFDGKNQYGHPCEIYSEHILPQAYNEGITIDFYMDKAPNIMNDEVFKGVLRQYNTKEAVNAEKDDFAKPDIMNTAAILKAISYRTYEEKTDYSTGEKYTIPTDNIDFNAKQVLKDYCRDGIPFENIMSFAHIMSACKEKTNPYSNEKFNPEILKKAIQLKENGVDEKEIPKIMEACKFEDTDYFGRKTKTFNDEMFQAVLSKSKEENSFITARKIELSKDLINGKEVFRPEVFDIVANARIWDEESDYRGGIKDFKIQHPNGDKRVDLPLLQAWLDAGQPEIRLISDEVNDVYTPNIKAIEAYNKLNKPAFRNWTSNYKPEQGGESDPTKVLMWACKDEYQYTKSRWNNKAFEHVIEMKDKGYSVNDVVNILYNCKEYVDNATTDTKDRLFMEGTYNYAMSLIEEQGIDIGNAGKIANASMSSGEMTQPENTEKMLELYKLGSKDPVNDVFYCKDVTSNDVNDVAYERMKDVLSRGLETNLIPACRDKGEFSDRLYRLALNLQDRGYSADDITRLMNFCHETVNTENVFQQKIYDHIKDLEDVGINQENIFTVLKSCNYNNNFSEAAFAKISELHNKGYDDKGIAVFIKNSSQDNEFFEPKYDNLLELSKKHTDLRDANHGDDYIITKLLQNESSVKRLKNVYGEDVNNYAVSMKIDGYINFSNQCSHLLEKFDSQFNNDLQARLNELPSPELKVKRLRVIGGLSYNVDQDALRPLINLIHTPKMTEEQIQLANNIFTPGVNEEGVNEDGVNEDDYPKDMSKAEIELKDYEQRVDKFLDEIKAPTQYRQTVRDFLMKERLNKSIERPKSIEEQKAQMEKNAQQMLINPKIPLDKKIIYIDEYKAKIKDMGVNPDKYLKPYIYPKPLEKLKKVVEAYVNVPNDDIKFNNTIKETMYSNMGIETTPELLSSINYDSKYFDKMFAVQQGFKDNFKTLIELKKMNRGKSLREARLVLPEEGTEKYDQYQRLGLIEQIKANLDTKRQIEEHGLNYDKWDSFDDNLRGETFTSEADPETEFKNLKYNVINIFQDDLWNSIKTEETQKLTEHLEKLGFKIFNNNLYSGGKVATNSDIENFINATVNYISKDEYWKGVNVNSDLPAEEIAGVTSFTDHIKGFQKRVDEIKNARTVNNIHFRLTNDDDIGRNIFFGNHVGCCNSVESSYAGYSAPMHLLNNYNRGIELVDEWGNSYGNSLCFFADIDDKLTFVIDSFEANGKLGSNPLVAEKLFEFAKQVCNEMGKPDAQIMVGPNYNNMDKSLLTSTGGHKIKVLGTVSEKTYCDSVGGKVKDEINIPVENKTMFLLKSDAE